jgi:hypothetical protein
MGNTYKIQIAYPKSVKQSRVNTPTPNAIVRSMIRFMTASTLLGWLKVPQSGKTNMRIYFLFVNERANL